MALILHNNWVMTAARLGIYGFRNLLITFCRAVTTTTGKTQPIRMGDDVTAGDGVTTETTTAAAVAVFMVVVRSFPARLLDLWRGMRDEWTISGAP
jgi:O-antigen ligase